MPLAAGGQGYRRGNPVQAVCLQATDAATRADPSPPAVRWSRAVIAIALAIHRLRSASAADCRAADWVEVRIRRALRRHLAASESVGFALDGAAPCRSNERDNLGLKPRWNAELGHRGAQKVHRTIPILGGQAHAA